MNHKQRRVYTVLYLIIFVAMLFLLAACGSPAAPASEPAAESEASAAEEEAQETAAEEAPAEAEPIKIGLSSAFTGPFASVGEGFEWGVTMAIEDLGNEIAGRPVELYTADNKCNPSDAVTAVRHLIDEEEVDAIIGSSCSGATLAALPIIQESEIVQLSVTSSNPDIYNQIGVGGNEWGFRLNLDDLIIARTLAPIIAEESETIFTIAQNNDFGRGAVDAYLRELPDVGVEVVGSEYVDPDTSDFRPILTKIKELEVDGILSIMVEADSAPFMRQLRELGIEANIYTRGGVTSPLFLELTSDDPSIGEGVLGASYWTKGIDPETEARFEERWDSPATVHRMMAYYGMRYVLADAIERAIEENGEVTRAGIREALESTSLETPLGQIEFDDHNQAYPDMTLDIVRDGKVELLDTIPGLHR